MSTIRAPGVLVIRMVELNKPKSRPQLISLLVWQRIESQVLLHCWEDACVVYQADSSDTHQLTRSAGNLLQLLTQQARDSNELAHLLFPELDSSALASEISALESTLAQLTQLGLIERRQA